MTPTQCVSLPPEIILCTCASKVVTARIVTVHMIELVNGDSRPTTFT